MAGIWSTTQVPPWSGPVTPTTQSSGGAEAGKFQFQFFTWNISRMIRLKTTFTDITADTLYDVLHDPVYRKVRNQDNCKAIINNPPPPLQTWDKHMICSKELGVLNPNNDVSYYALQCPPPVKNRDFVLQRSWLQTPQEVGSRTTLYIIKGSY